jgi:hypothetical protein
MVGRAQIGFTYNALETQISQHSRSRLTTIGYLLSEDKEASI